MKNNFFKPMKKILNKNNVIVYADLFQNKYNIKCLADQLYFFMKNQKNKTFVIPCYTNIFLYRTNKKKFFFNKRESKNGYLSNYLINKKGVFRSNHPTNSFLFIGKNAKKFASYDIKNCSPHKIFEFIGFENLISFGINWNGSNTFHVAEYISGVSKKNLACGLVGSFYKKNNKYKWFSLEHIHGCSEVHMNNYKKKYVSNKLVNIKNYGSLKIYFSDFKRLLDFEVNLLNKNIRYFMCKNKNCLYCGGLITLDIQRLINFYVKNFIKIIKLLINGIAGSLNNRRF